MKTTLILAILLGLCGVLAQALFSSSSALYQLGFLVVGILLYSIVVTKTSTQTLVPASFLLSFFGIGSLILLLLFGDPVRGSSRWFSLFGYSIQPSVVFVPFFLLTFSTWLSQNRPYANWRTYITALILSAIPIGLVFIQPDFGTSAILGITAFTLIVYSGVRLTQLLLIALAPLPLFFFAPYLLKPYQLARLTSFLNPGLDPLGINYNSLQSVIAIGSGGLLGKGFFRTSQSRLQFLPEAHTDFIFASWTEIFGFVGAFFLICLFAWFLFSLFAQRSDEKNVIHQFYRTGFGVYLFLETAINVGMNLRLLPVVGVPFPLISYGGSAVLTVFLGLAINNKLREL